MITASFWDENSKEKEKRKKEPDQVYAVSLLGRRNILFLEAFFS